MPLNLEIEQAKLFEELTAAVSSVPNRSDREEFMFLRTFGGDSVQGNGLQVDVLFEDIIALDDAGLIRVTQRHRKGSGFNFVLSPGAKERYEESRVGNESAPPIDPAIEIEVDDPGQSADDPKAVMVVHGRNREARDAMFAFLRRLGLRPLDWNDLIDRTEDAAPYVGEVLSKAFSDAQAVVVLLTPDDEARLRDGLHGPDEKSFEIDLTPQARPNVLFEAGMAMASHPGRTVLVEIGKLRPFSDITGRHAVRLDGTDGPLRAIARRLGRAGCSVEPEEGDGWADPSQFPSPDDETTSSEPSDGRSADGVARDVDYLHEDARRWIADRDRTLKAEMSERAGDLNSRGLLYSGAWGASMAILRRQALHEYRDEISNKRREYARIRDAAGSAADVPPFQLDEESLATIDRWREPIETPGGQAVQVDDPTDAVREPDIRRFEASGDGLAD